MSVLVDTSVWSLALRRTKPTSVGIVRQLTSLVEQGLVAMIGPIRQELLSGVRRASQFAKLRDHLRAFPDIRLDHLDHEEAATCFNRCRAKGVQGSNTDFLIAAVAVRYELEIFTTDRNFLDLARLLPIKLYRAEA